MILRDLITRFSFETDKRGVHKFDQTLKGMRGSLTKFLGILGVGLGAKEMWDLDQATTQARFDLQRFAGVNFKPLHTMFLRVNNEINSLRKGAGSIIKPQDFDQAATTWIQTFGNNSSSLANFRNAWKFAAKQSALTGRNAKDVMAEIEQGVRGGGFDTLLSIPGFDVFKKQMMEWQQQVIDPQSPGGWIKIQQRMQTMMKALANAGKEQDSSLKKLPEKLLQSREAAKNFQKIMTNLAHAIDKLLIPTLEKLNGFLEQFNTKSDRLGIGKATVDTAIKMLPKNMQKPTKDFVSIPASAWGGPQGKGNRPATWWDVLLHTNPWQAKPENAPTVINQTNHINISNPDPKATADEVDRRLKQHVQDAKNKILRTEND